MGNEALDGTAPEPHTPPFLHVTLAPPRCQRHFSHQLAPGKILRCSLVMGDGPLLDQTFLGRLMALPNGERPVLAWGGDLEQEGDRGTTRVRTLSISQHLDQYPAPGR